MKGRKFVTEMVLGKKNGIMVVLIIMMEQGVNAKPAIMDVIAKQLIQMKYVADMG